jgi:hypothetical protein
MRNPQIVTRLNSMMNAEKQAKMQIIECVMNHYNDNRQSAPNCLVSEFDRLYELDLAQLNDLLSDLISVLYAEINERLEIIITATRQ